MYAHRRIPLSLILRIDGRNMLVFTALAVGVYALQRLADFDLSLPFVIVGTIGTAVAVLLGFKNSAAYERWWEARKIWGDIASRSGYLTAQLLSFAGRDAADRGVAEIVRRHLAFVNTLRHQLRGETVGGALRAWLPEEEVAVHERVRNPAASVLTRQCERLTHLRADGLVEEFQLYPLLGTVGELMDLAARAERIATTPLMRHYSYFTTAFVWVFVVLLPFGFAGVLGWTTIPLVVAISTIFTMLDRAGSFTEDPFSGGFNDVPLSAICRDIEIDMLQQVGLSPVPEPLVVEDGILM